MSRPDWNRPRRADQHLIRPIPGSVFYRPGADEHRHCGHSPFPIPQIQPRERRIQSIRVISYPSGYVPDEPRADLARCRKAAAKAKRKKSKGNNEAAAAAEEEEGDSHRPRRVFEKVLAPFKLPSAHPIGAHVLPHEDVPQSPTEISPVSPTSNARPLSMISIPPPGTGQMANAAPIPAGRRASMMSTALHSAHRNSGLSVRSAKSVMSSVTEVPKPVASGSGVQCSIILAEPNVFLTGFEHDGHPRHETTNSTALLRGKLQLSVTKNVKLRSVTLKLHGKARTEWPEGIPPLKDEQHEEVSLRTQALTFFHATHETWETEFGNQCTYSLQKSTESSDAAPSPMSSSLAVPSALRRGPTGQLSAQDYKRLSLQSVQSRSFGKGEMQVTEVAQPKSYKVFRPGRYEYAFELPIDHHQLETTRLQFGSVKWELEAIVERAGAFKPNLHGSKEVRIVRVPDQLSLEMTEPISISRQWEDQLHYDIMISGKSFPIGSQIPIAFKLTPLAKVQVHKIKVFVTESVEYWTNDRKVTRKDQGRKLLLLEKIAGKPLDKQYESSDIRILSGGELSPDQRVEARAAATRRRGWEASANRTTPQPLPDPSENILGDLDLGLESFWGPTEIEMNVQIPTCDQMGREKNARLHPDCSWKNVNVHHWIKIVMRISRLDPDDPAGKKRRHFEISIDSPFTVLDCRATQANTALPEYSGSERPIYHQHARCGCPDAEILATNPSPASSTGSIPSVSVEPGSATAGIEGSSVGIARPPLAHVQQHPAASSQPVQRPMHLLRYPSHNPPAFDADDPPPPMPTPPPQYDLVVGTPSVDGLADYFARLADYNVDDDGDEDSGDDDEAVSIRSRLTERTGRVNVPHPRTPGGRLVPSRSLEIQRPPVPPPDGLHITGALRQRRG
ncbi:hypothetical protein F4777DRAFT_135996 [Nemania sp. FL0916]|nr:hypothetical protein F4777DRAFT_135996 [Nemania sp. FL0916]